MPVDEAAWLEAEAARYRNLTFNERVAIFRDLERCVRALAPDVKGPDPLDLDLGERWTNPAGACRQ